jgi:hypothetical protein
MALAIASDSGWQGYYDRTGPTSIEPTNVDGNLLVLYAAWDRVNSTTSTAPVPASNVADSSRNWWRLGADSGPGNSGARCAIWFCQNAQAISGWLSFALMGYAASLVWKLVEFSGLPANYYPVIDFGPDRQQSSNSATTLTNTATAVTADFAFGIGCMGTNATTIAPPGGAWTQAGTPVYEGSPNGVGATAAYATYAAASAVSAAWTAAAGPQFMASCILGLSQASSSPAQPSSNTPNFLAALALGTTPGDPTRAILENQWADISPRTYGPANSQIVTASRGQQYELAQPEAGPLTVACNNQDGAFNPYNPASPYYSTAINQNISFQLAVAPWIASVGSGAPPSIAQSNAQAMATGQGASAVYSLAVTPAGGTNPAASSEHVPVSVNRPYSLSAWFFAGTAWASGCQVGINWFTAGNTFISSDFSAAVPLAANTWTQVTYLNRPVPATAAYGVFVVQLAGVPGFTFYVAEAAIVPGPAAVQTGLVRQGCPVRLLAWWQGRGYPAGFGYVERWPQDWPDGLAQWGFSTMVAVDSVGVASSTQMPSSMQGEILADGPYVCLPMGDQYSASQNTINGVVKTAGPADGLIATNTSRTSQRTGTYRDGGNQPVQTGQSLGFQGDGGTGMGTSSYNALDTSGFRGPGVVYGPDTGLPTVSNGFSVELWFTVPTLANQGTVSILQLLQIIGQPYIASEGVAFDVAGFVAGSGIYLPATTGPPVVYLQVPSSGALFVGPTPVSFGALIHLVVQVHPDGAVQWYVNGVNQGATLAGGTPVNQLTAVLFGQSSYPNGSGYTYLWNWNYAAAYGCVYPYLLPARRIAAHYTSGISGFSGDSTAIRFGRYLEWAGVGVRAAGPGAVTDNMQLGPAYSTAGAPLSSALNADCLSSGARWYCDQSGNLVLLPRPVQYNNQLATGVYGSVYGSVYGGGSVSVIFDDGTASGGIPYSPKLGFDYDNSYVNGIVQTTLQQGPNTLISPIEKDADSIAQYFPRGPLQQPVSGTSLQDAFDRAYWSLNKYRQPSMRVRTLEVDLAARPSATTQVLKTGLADVALVNRHPLGGPPYSLLVTIEKMFMAAGPGVFTMQYQMSPYTPENAVLTADTTNDVLGSNTLAWLCRFPRLPGQRTSRLRPSS